MDAKGGKGSFMYHIPSPFSSPRISTHNNTKTTTADQKQDKALKKAMEWQHDHQPPSSYYASTSVESNRDKKGKANPSQESVSDSHTEDNEVVPSSLPEPGEESRQVQRFSSRLLSRQKAGKPVRGKSVDSRQHWKSSKRTLGESIYVNNLQIEKIKDHRGKLKREIKRLCDLVSNDDSEIRTLERANMQLETQRETLRRLLFASETPH
jgi:hypothetical protein